MVGLIIAMIIAVASVLVGIFWNPDEDPDRNRRYKAAFILFGVVVFTVFGLFTLAMNLKNYYIGFLAMAIIGAAIIVGNWYLTRLGKSASDDLLEESGDYDPNTPTGEFKTKYNKAAVWIVYIVGIIIILMSVLASISVAMGNSPSL